MPPIAADPAKLKQFMYNLLSNVMREKGDAVLVEANPEEHVELARIPVFDSKTWIPHAFAAPYLLVRTDAEAICCELALAD